jgi:hypothetical protein
MSTQTITATKVNGYSICWNEIFGGYDVTHPEIGFCGYFNTEADAIEYCEKG